MTSLRPEPCSSWQFSFEHLRNLLCLNVLLFILCWKFRDFIGLIAPAQFFLLHRTYMLYR